MFLLICMQMILPSMIVLNQLHIWCKNNGMVLNSAKTKVMLITTSQKRHRLPSTNLNYNEESLKMISKDKILGVFVDDNLVWYDHVKHICKNISSYIWLLSKIKIFFCRKSTVFNFTNLIYSLTLTFAVLSGPTHLSPIK